MTNVPFGIPYTSRAPPNDFARYLVTGIEAHAAIDPHAIEQEFPQSKALHQARNNAQAGPHFNPSVPRFHFLRVTHHSLPSLSAVRSWSLARSCPMAGPVAAVTTTLARHARACHHSARLVTNVRARTASARPATAAAAASQHQDERNSRLGYISASGISGGGSGSVRGDVCHIDGAHPPLHLPPHV